MDLVRAVWPVLRAWAFWLLWGAIALGLGYLSGVAMRPAFARDLGQWSDNNKAWFQSLKQPDHPTVSCCGEADAYFADSYKVAPDGSYIAIITDERDDGPLMRPHIPVGTEVPIPANKLKFDKGNPTGHGIVFMGYGFVFCYLPPGGV